LTVAIILKFMGGRMCVCLVLNHVQRGATCEVIPLTYTKKIINRLQANFNTIHFNIMWVRLLYGC
jgi:hypothetical protein